MGTNTLNNLVLPHTPSVDDWNQYFTALAGDFVPRNPSSGAAEDNIRKLGQASTRWKEAHITDLFLGGALFDPSTVGVNTNWAINSGATRSGSGQPDFLRASGSGATATILATTTNLQITADGSSVTVSSDIAISSLTTAPATNNTCLVNDTALAGGEETKYTGELNHVPITIDAVGSEISGRIGEYICLKHNTTGEYIFAFVEDATTLDKCYRGFFFDSSGAPVERDVLNDNDQLNIMSLGWVFLDNDGVTVDVSYKSPSFSGVEPASPATDDYWFDITNSKMKRYDGAVWQEVDRVLIGLLVIDGTNCVASRSFDFTKSYDELIQITVEVKSDTVAQTAYGYSVASVYGSTIDLPHAPFQWDIATDLESGLTEAASTHYFLYITEEAKPIISDVAPYDRLAELRGFYHPYHSWRCVGKVYNNSSSNMSFFDEIIPSSDIVAKIELRTPASSIPFSDIFKPGRMYEITYNNIDVSVDGADLFVRFEQGGSFISSSYITAGSFAGTSLTYIQIANNVEADQSGSASGKILFFNPRGSIFNKNLMFDTAQRDTAGTMHDYSGTGQLGGGASASDPVTGISFHTTSGNIDAAFITVREKLF